MILMVVSPYIAIVFVDGMTTHSNIIITFPFSIIIITY